MHARIFGALFSSNSGQVTNRGVQMRRLPFVELATMYIKSPINPAIQKHLDTHVCTAYVISYKCLYSPPEYSH